MPRRGFALTRSFYPYSLYAIVCIGVSLLGIFDWYKLNDLSFLIASLFLWVIVIATQYGNTRYRILWNDGEIKQISVNNIVTIISCSDISRIAQEKSSVESRISVRRPADRIAIYAGRGSEEKYIDVSLRHFTSDDIRKLMRAIHAKRPDLAIPRHWA
jgi:hypothetical protein